MRPYSLNIVKFPGMVICPILPNALNGRCGVTPAREGVQNMNHMANICNIWPIYGVGEVAASGGVAMARAGVQNMNIY